MANTLKSGGLVFGADSTPGGGANSAPTGSKTPTPPNVPSGASGPGQSAPPASVPDPTQGFATLAGGLAQALQGNAANVSTSAPLVDHQPASSGSPGLALLVLVGGGAGLYYLYQRSKAAA